MQKQTLLFLILSSLFLSAADQLYAQDRKLLQKKTEGEYEIKVFSFPQQNAYAYQILKQNKVVVEETIVPAMGSVLGYKKGNELVEEIVKIAKEVTVNIRRYGVQSVKVIKQ